MCSTGGANISMTYPCCISAGMHLNTRTTMERVRAIREKPWRRLVRTDVMNHTGLQSLLGTDSTQLYLRMHASDASKSSLGDAREGGAHLSEEGEGRHLGDNT